NSVGQITYLVRRMQSPTWVDYWNFLGLCLVRFHEVGLTPTSTDAEVWMKCQDEELVLITDNRNLESPDSLEATIQRLNSPTSLPVITIGDIKKIKTSRHY